jgi:hypothetical protein
MPEPRTVIEPECTEASAEKEAGPQPAGAGGPQRGRSCVNARTPLLIAGPPDGDGPALSFVTRWVEPPKRRPEGRWVERLLEQARHL